MDKEPIITLEGISKTFNGRTAPVTILNGADIKIYRGETIAVVGASGIGKSTLLNVIGTLDRPDSGRVVFREKDLLTFGDDHLARFRNENIGFVFQFHYLLQGFTALENVMMPGLIAGMSKKTIEKQAINMLERVELKMRLRHRAEDLSGGEQQRVALARALVMSPDLLLADEPTGNLDEQNSDRVHSLLRELNRELGMTIVVVTHNSELAGMMDKKVTLKDGLITAA